MTFDKGWASRAVSAADVVAHVKSGDSVFVHGAAATPVPLLEVLSARTDVEDVRCSTCPPAGRPASSRRRWQGGNTLRERGEALISIAHPDFRAELRAQLREVRHSVPA
jgi:acyl-CoA hydrolase